MDVKEGLKEAQKTTIKSDHFWGRLVSIVSILEGLFILYHDDTLTERLDVYLLSLDEDIFGWLLVILGVSKLVGVFIENKHLMAISIIGLSIVWGMLFTVSILWSFGVGYPSNSFLINGMMIATCLRIAHQGIFHRYGSD